MPAKKSRYNGPPKRSARLRCQHTSIRSEPCFHASEVGYSYPTEASRAEAQGVNLKSYQDNPSTFPAPLILPNDDLALYPNYPPQSLASWTNGSYRNPVTARRRTIYIAPPPSFDTEVSFATSWANSISISKSSQPTIATPQIEDLATYIRAFYYPLPVKLLPSSSFKLVPWSTSDQQILKAPGKGRTAAAASDSTALIGLQTPTEIVGVRARPGSQHDFARQLNLNDLLDAAIASVPSDAYALLLLVDQDLYEDDDDAFVCGRAYGGSRVSVVSTARYNPALDGGLRLDLEHAWPLSHCADFIEGLRSKRKARTMTTKKRSLRDGDKDDDDTKPATSALTHGPLHDAVQAASTFYSRYEGQEDPTSLWLSRLARTTAHELGHCFGMDHCVYYACFMQGSASLYEDHRQPPYLCPVDLAKVLTATGASEEEHLKALLEFCEGIGMKASMFVAMGAWIRARLVDMGVTFESAGDG